MSIRIVGDENAFTIRAIDSMFQEYEVVNGEQLYEGDYTFTIYMNDNYSLTRAYFLDSMLQEYEINNGTFSYYYDGYGMEIYVETESIQPDREVTGFNKLYKVDNEILTSIAGERFVLNGEDLGNYIINILELPFSLDSVILGDENPIRLGSHQLTTAAIEIIKDMITIDLGTIHVPVKYNNSYDYTNTIATLHLPFSNAITLELEYVIGYDIGITYILDLYFGDITVNISSSRVNKVIHSETFKIGRDIPFIRKVGGDTVNQLSSSSGVLNGVLSPYVEVIRNKILNESNIFSNSVTVYDQLQNVSGYVSVDNIVLSTNANASEKESIISQLRNGVYIK